MSSAGSDFTSSRKPPIFDEPGSFRDPAGRIIYLGNRVLREVKGARAQELDALLATAFLQDAIRGDRVIATSKLVGRPFATEANDRSFYEHRRLPYISYPYEWTFDMLRDAALLQLGLIKDGLSHGVTMSDATAYNLQFVGSKPIFIDILSFVPYKRGMYWQGYRQFSEQFLNPLLLTALFSVPFNGWYRGQMEGIPASTLARFLKLRHLTSWRTLVHVWLQSRLDWKNSANLSCEVRSPDRDRKALRPLSERAFAGIMDQLETWIRKLSPGSDEVSLWSLYTKCRTYDEMEVMQKNEILARFVAECKPSLLLDLGSNTGEFSALALANGASYVVGVENDPVAANHAYRMARDRHLAFLPLVMDAADPSPDRGWSQKERKGFGARAQFDAMIALAFEHHLAIGRNVPLEALVRWLVSLAPRGLVEFVPKTDRMVQFMLSSRENIFAEYTESAFKAHLNRHARIERAESLSSEGRILFQYSRA
jgi:SAM-dependent methyltransferase